MFVRYRAVPPPVTSVFILAKDTAKGPTSNVCDSTRKVDVVHDNFLENVINCLPTITDVSAPLPAVRRGARPSSAARLYATPKEP